jgi:hypothetical protein
MQVSYRVSHQFTPLADLLLNKELKKDCEFAHDLYAYREAGQIVTIYQWYRNFSLLVSLAIKLTFPVEGNKSSVTQQVLSIMLVCIFFPVIRHVNRIFHEPYYVRPKALPDPCLSIVNISYTAGFEGTRRELVHLKTKVYFNFLYNFYQKIFSSHEFTDMP